MRKSVVALVIGAALIGTAANARDGAAYIGFEGGGSVGSGPQIDVGTTQNAAQLETDSNWGAGFLLGYDFGSFRIEAEASRNTSNQQQLVANGTFDVDPVSTGTQAFASVSGDVNSRSFMLNAVYDYGGEDGVAIFGGLGLGVNRTAIDTKIAGVATPLYADRDNGFAWQVLAGARLPVNDTLELGVKYRLFNAGGIDLDSAIGAPATASFTSHSVLATLTINFGG